MWAVNLSEPRITWCRWPKPLATKRIRFYSVMSRTTHIIIHAAAERTASVNHVCKVKNAHGAVINTSPWTKTKRKRILFKSKYNWAQILLMLCPTYIYTYPCCVVLLDILVWREFIYFHFPSACLLYTLLYSARPSIFNKALLWARQNNKSLD